MPDHPITVMPGGDEDNPLNRTTSIPSEAGWSEDSLPLIIGQLDPQASRSQMLGWVPTLVENGQNVLDTEGQAVRDFQFLPRHLSSNLEWFRYEAYLRMDPRLRYRDLWARMPRGTPKLDVNSINNHRIRGIRRDNHARCWDRKGPKAPKADVMASQHWGQAQLDANTTWEITLQGIRHGNSGVFLPNNTFLDHNTLRHSPSQQVQDAITTRQRLEAAALVAGLAAISDLPRTLQPTSWYSRVRNKMSETNTTGPTSAHLPTAASSMPVTNPPQGASSPVRRARVKRKRSESQEVEVPKGTRKRGRKRAEAAAVAAAGTSDAHDASVTPTSGRHDAYFNTFAPQTQQPREIAGPVQVSDAGSAAPRSTIPSEDHSTRSHPRASRARPARPSAPPATPAYPPHHHAAPLLPLSTARTATTLPPLHHALPAIAATLPDPYRYTDHPPAPPSPPFTRTMLATRTLPLPVPHAPLPSTPSYSLRIAAAARVAAAEPAEEYYTRSSPGYFVRSLHPIPRNPVPLPRGFFSIPAPVPGRLATPEESVAGDEEEEEEGAEAVGFL
ncbi:hypothetical protein MMC18_006302 [Xylographa bjoerkii]|nr:hypothetical protein [Xylographa bjoerkii]